MLQELLTQELLLRLSAVPMFLLSQLHDNVSDSRLEHCFLCHGARSDRNSGGANVLLDCLARWTRRSTRRKETENQTWASIRLWRTELVPIQLLIQFPSSPWNDTIAMTLLTAGTLTFALAEPD